MRWLLLGIMVFRAVRSGSYCMMCAAEGLQHDIRFMTKDSKHGIADHKSEAVMPVSFPQTIKITPQAVRSILGKQH